MASLNGVHKDCSSERRSYRAACVHEVATVATRDKATEPQWQWRLEGAHMQGGNGNSGGGRVCVQEQEQGQGTNEGWGAQMRVGNTNREWGSTKEGHVN